MEETVKSSFFARAVAYLIDIFIVSTVAFGLLQVIPVDKNHEKYVNEYNELKEKLEKKEITNKEFVNRSKDIVYDIDYTNTTATLTQIALVVGYFVVFQYLYKGQTLGKKLMKIKIVSTKEKELTLNQVAFRSLLANSIIIKLLLIGAVLFLNRDYYYYSSMMLQIIDSTIIVTIIIMILFRKDKRGLHDFIAGTEVISTK